MSAPQELNRPTETPVFNLWIRSFLRHHKSDIVVDIGSDPRLELAFAISPYCGIVHSVNFPQEHREIKGWYELHRRMGSGGNIELTSGDALHLSDLIPHADVVIAQNVLLDGNNGDDTTLMWQYRRGDKECSDEEWEKLRERFTQAEIDGFTEFLKVANPGYVIKFARASNRDVFMKMLIENLGIDPEKIERRKMLYDAEDEEEWETFIIDNS